MEVTVFKPGTEAFLQQAHRNNWQTYLASLQPDAQEGWNLCVLTASNERQAATYEQQLSMRRQAKMLPPKLRFLVVPDPGGQRIGSGGATLRVLQKLRETDPELLCSGRVLIIHSGGDSRRLPHCSATGKLFARIPRLLPGGRASTLFDEFLIALSGVATTVPAGVLVASGDVMLLFDHLQLQLRHPGVIGVAAAAPAKMGTHHGVYVLDSASHLKAYLHKPPIEHLQEWDAIDEEGNVGIDTGLVWLDAPTVQRFVALADEPAVSRFCALELTAPPPKFHATGLNLYGDLLMPLAGPTTYDEYMADTSDGPATRDIRAARETIWQQMRGISFTVECLQPAAFLHFGTSYEYWSLIADSPALRRMYGWTSQTACWTGTPDHCVEDSEIVALNAVIGSDTVNTRQAAILMDSEIHGALRVAEASLLANVRTTQELDLYTALVLHQLPLPNGHVTRIYGLGDDPKRPVGSPESTFMNQPWAQWLDRSGLDPEILWPDIPTSERTLWNAALYPITENREDSLTLSLPLQAPETAPSGWKQAWQQSQRLSLAASFAQADAEQILADQDDLQQEVCARCFWSAIKAEEPAVDVRERFGIHEDEHSHCLEHVTSWIDESDPVCQLRGYKALEIATGDHAWEDRAFETLAELIASAFDAQYTVHRNAQTEASTRDRVKTVRVESAARIDFGGGWTDTPPYSIERGGTVLNAAVTLRGAYPIIVEAERLDEQKLVLESRDIGTSISPVTAEKVLAFNNPADPFALLKAALVLRGIVPSECDPEQPLTEILAATGGGLRLTTQTTIPRGSGLGTSSILGGAVLSALAQVTGVSLSPGELFDEVLTLEQMMTTGGGWQDQVGGLVGGIKVVSSKPGLPQKIQVDPVLLPPEMISELSKRLVLVYTGQRRLAKNLLQRVMGRWMARDPEMVWIQQEIARLALAMRDKLLAGDVGGFGAHLSEHWDLNKRMDPGCTNPFIDDLFTAMAPYISGAKVAGAGGGGFVIAIARTVDSVASLAEMLARAYAGTQVQIWPCAIPEEGIVSQVQRH